jgi:hypothetical protein
MPLLLLVSIPVQKFIQRYPAATNPDIDPFLVHPNGNPFGAEVVDTWPLTDEMYPHWWALVQNLC